MRLLLSTFLLCVVGGLFAQRGAPVLTGARGAAMSNAAVTLTGIDGAFANQAGLATLETLTATLTGERRFNLGELQSFAAAGALPTGSGTFGLSLHYFGFEAYNEQKIGLAYARRLSSQVAIGGQFVLLNTRIPEYGSQVRATFEVGFQATLLPELTLAAHLYSPMRVSVLEGEYLPSILRIGTAYHPSEQIILVFEVEKDVDFPIRTKGGLEYRVIEALALRAGFATGPVGFSFGAGYRVADQIRIDFGAYYHQQLGFTPAISATYQK